MSAPSDPAGDDLVGDLIAEVARTHGIAISRDDPVIAVVLLNQAVLRRYLEEVVAPVTAAIREAAAEIEQFAQAQASWLEQLSLKDRASFLEEHKAMHTAWKMDMESLIQGQNGALQQVVMQTIALLRNLAPAAGPALATSPAPRQTQEAQTSAPTRKARPWAWLWAGMLLGTGATVALTLGAVVWRPFAGQ